LIPLALLGISHDENGFLSASSLIALKAGAEASPFADYQREVVYKLFDLRATGALGKKIVLEKSEDGSFDLYVRDAVLMETVEKLMILNESGAHPTEIVGLADSGDYLLVKQPLAFPMSDFESDREAAINAMKGIAPRAPIRQRLAVVWLNGSGWLVGDLHERNIMRNADGQATIIDALVGVIPPGASKALVWLSEALHDARVFRETGFSLSRRAFDDVSDDEL
jgi:hypothetical protein